MITETENLWMGDNFFSTIDDLIADAMECYLIEEDIPETLAQKIHCSDMEPIRTFTPASIAEALYGDILEVHEQGDVLRANLEKDMQNIGIDVMLNVSGPKWYTPSERHFILTKADIVKYLKENQEK